MTTELERQFFDTFGIYLREARICRNVNNCSKKYELCNDDCKHWQTIRKEYPQITDGHYLELICVLSNYWVETSKRPYLVLLAPNLGELKENVLSACILHKIYKPLYKQVQAIFEVKR